MLPDKFHPRRLLRLIPAMISVVAVICIESCKVTRVPHVTGNPLDSAIVGMDKSERPWGSWNALLKLRPGHTVSSAILDVENALIDRFNADNPTLSKYTIRFQVFYCPCDTLLYNIKGTLYNGNGDAVTTPPPPPGQGGSGDALFVSNNNTVGDRDTFAVRNDNGKYNLSYGANRAEVDTSSILAIIDTGLDPNYFSSEIQTLIWSEGPNTIYNVVGPDIHSYLDDHHERHGTIVTAVALKAVQDQNKSFGAQGNHLPKVMVLKALDQNKKGSTFTVSCALSYAIQHRAAVINASLGYIETTHHVDSVLRYYIDSCRKVPRPISVFAAAGNLPDTNPAVICSSPGLGNQLNENRMFYPGCFSNDFNNVFSVTTLKDTHASCFYQNYSEQFVSFGVIQVGIVPSGSTVTTNACCHFWVPFAMANGSSYATPVGSGTAISYLLNGHLVTDFITSLSKETNMPQPTKEGKYFNYKSD